MIENPWDIRPSDDRLPNTLKTFIIFCEDEHHERIYFKSFEDHLPNLKINAIPNLRSKKLNLNATIHICRNEGLIGFQDGAYRILEGVTSHLWCVYDRDAESEQFAEIPPQNNIDFDTAIINAQQAGLKVAWSNDLFELWILLHFEQVPNHSMLHRNYVYDRLTYLFKHELGANADLQELTNNDTFSYKANMKRRERFLVHVVPLLYPLRETAIQHARQLEAEFTQAVPYHLRNPCTMVHHLVLEILNVDDED